MRLCGSGFRALSLYDATDFKAYLKFRRSGSGSEVLLLPLQKRDWNPPFVDLIRRWMSPTGKCGSPCLRMIAVKNKQYAIESKQLSRRGP
jgi:hypothetical protein